MPEENKLAGNLLQTNEEADRKAQARGQEPQNTQPVYNPLLGISRREFVQVLAGNNPDAPLMTTDKFGTPKFHLENFGLSAPTKVKVGPYGQSQVEGVKEAMERNQDQLSQDLFGFHQSFAQEISRDQSRSSYFNESLQAVPQFFSSAGKSGGSMIMHSAHAILAQQRNLSELEWEIEKNTNKNNPNFIEAGAIVKEWQDQGRNIQILNVNNLDVSDETKQFLRDYQKLDRDRTKDERRMRIAMAYDQDKTWVDNAMARTTWINPLGGDENSVIHTVANLGGDVAGSLAVFWATGNAAGMLGRGLGLIGRTAQAAQKVTSAAEATTLALEGGVDASLIAAANIGSAAVFAPSFLNQYDQIRTEALLSGKSIGEANAIGFAAGVAEGALESVGFKWFNRFYTDGGWIQNYLLRNIVPEALQEGLQTSAENVITQTFGVTDKDWADIMGEIGLSIAAGALGGGMFSFYRARTIGMGAWAEGVAENLSNKWKNLTREQVNKVTDTVNQAVEKIETSGKFEDKVDYMEIFRKNSAEKEDNAKPKDKEIAEILKDFKNLSEDEKAGAEAYLEAYQNLKNHYIDRMDEKNPNLTLKQKANGWKAIRLQIMAQRDSNALVSTFENAINQAAAYLAPDSEVVKHNTKELEERLRGANYTEEQIKALTDPENINNHEAQWQVTEDYVVNRAKGSGIAEPEAKLIARFVKSLAYDATLVNPGVDPRSIVSKMSENMINVQIGTLHGQNIPDMFKSVLEQIDPTSFANLNDKQKFEHATKIVTALNSKEVDPSLAAQINKELYDDATTDPDLSRTKASVFQQGELFGIILKHMPLNNTSKYDNKVDHATMVLLRRMGMDWKGISELYGMTSNTDKDLDDVFEERAQKYLPKLTDDQIDKLGYIEQNATPEQDEIFPESNEPTYTPEQTQQMKEGTGFFEPDEQAAVLVNPQIGTALHEYGHFSLTYMVTSSTQLEKAGLLSDMSPIHRAYTYLRNVMANTGIAYTEEQLQETILDAMNDVIARGQSDDPILTGLINEMRELGVKKYQRLSGSLYSRQGKNAITKEAKQEISKAASSLLSGITPGTMLSDAYRLREESRLERIPDEFKNVNDAPLRQWADSIKEFARKYPLMADVEMVALDVAVEQGDAIKIAQCANSIATKAIDTATNMLVANKSLTDDGSIPTGQTSIFFEKDLTKGSQDYVAHFYDTQSIEQKLKDVKWKDSWGLLLSGVKNIFQSAEGAAGEVDEALGKGKGNKRGSLRTLLMKEFYDFGMSMQKYRDTAKPLVDAITKHMQKLERTPAEYQKEAKLWQRKFLLPLRNGQPGAYKKAGDFIEERLGLDARNSWEFTVDLIKEAKEKMLMAGVSADLLAWDGDFFPFAVKDYEDFVKGFLGHAHAFSNNEKERARFIAEYKKKHPKETDENIKRLYIALVDSQNSLMQRNSDTETKVSSFFKRRIDYVSDPAIMEYYKAPFDCLDNYMEAAYRTIMMRNLVGRVTYNKDGSPIFVDGQITTGKIGAYLATIPEGAVPKEVLDGFVTKMQYLAQRDSGAKNTIADIARQVNQITTLGNFFSAANQVLDLEFCASLFGFDATKQAFEQIMKKAGNSLTLEDVGALSTNEAYRIQDESALASIGKKVFKWSGFEWTDRKIKEVILNSAASWAQNITQKVFSNKKLSKADAQQYAELKYILDECYPEFDMRMLPPGMSEKEALEIQNKRNAKRNKLMKTLSNGGKDENGEWDTDAKYVYWYLLTKLQPINAATVAANYNKMGAIGKMMYQFTTVATRQIGFLGDYWRMKEKTGGKIVAAKGMMQFLMFCAAIGIPNDVIQDILKGKQPTLGKSFVMSPLHVLMVNEYTIAVAKREGIASAIATQFTPKLGVLDNLTKDAVRFLEGKDFKFNTSKNIPILGVFMYQFMFGGLDQKIKTKTDIFGRTQDPTKAREVKEANRKKAESLKFMEEIF